MTPAPSQQPQAGIADNRLGWPVWRLAIVIVFGAFASGLDSSLVNVALESIRIDLSASLATTQWVANVYLLALAVSLPLAGWAGERFGAGRVWLVALTGFTLASVLCALSGTIGMLIAMRALQGLAGGILIPAGQTVLGQAAGAEKLGSVIASLGIVVTLAPALGPVIGGFMLNWLSWPWLFAVNLPIGIIGVVLGARYIPRGQPTQGKQLDLTGVIMLSAGLPLGVFGLTGLSAASDGLTAPPLIAFALSVLLLAGYIIHARRTSDPVLRISLLRKPPFLTAVISTCFTGMLIFGSGLIFPLYFQLIHGDGTIETGLRLLSFGGGTALALPFCGYLVDRLGAAPVALAGTAVSLVSALLLLFVASAEASMVIVQALLFIYGVAIAFAATPPTIAAYKAVDSTDLSQATTQVNIVQRLGGALGGAVFTVVLARGLEDTPEQGFRWAFICISVAAAFALVSAVGMWTTRSGQISKRNSP